MKLSSSILLLLLVLVGVFAALNWTVFSTSTVLNLGVADIQAPLGLIMLGALVAVAAMFLLYVVYLQSTVLLDARGHAKELQANRKLADQAEASRFTELRDFLNAELKRAQDANQQNQDAILQRVSELERAVLLGIEQSGNSLAANLGEIDDRLRQGRMG